MIGLFKQRQASTIMEMIREEQNPHFYGAYQMRIIEAGGWNSNCYSIGGWRTRKASRSIRGDN
jgi:hypothetical protein